MKIWLDDERKPPDATWTWYDNAHTVIRTLARFPVDHISLDHDLGPEKYGTGYMVMIWIEEQVHTNPKYKPPVIAFHTQNPVGRANMERSRASIRAQLLNRSGH